MIEDVEELSAKAESDFFGKLKQTLGGNIRLPGSETSQHVTTKIPLGTGRCRRKCGPIEDLAAGILRPEEFKRHARIQVWARRQRDAIHKKGPAHDVNRRRR